MITIKNNYILCSYSSLNKANIFKTNYKQIQFIIFIFPYMGNDNK